MDFEEGKHPRGKDGKFIPKGAIEEAKSDPKKAAALRASVRPEDAAKLDAQLKNEPKAKAKAAGKQSQRDAEAVKDYSTDRFQNINAGLRTGQLEASDARIVEGIDRHLESQPKREGSTLRSFQADPATFRQIEQALESGTLTDPAYTSTRKTPTLTDRAAFQQKLTAPGQVVLKVTGRNGVDISEHSLNPAEGEVLYPRGTRFKVDKYVKTEGGGLLAELTEIEPARKLDAQLGSSPPATTAKPALSQPAAGVISVAAKTKNADKVIDALIDAGDDVTNELLKHYKVDASEGYHGLASKIIEGPNGPVQQPTAKAKPGKGERAAPEPAREVHDGKNEGNSLIGTVARPKLNDQEKRAIERYTEDDYDNLNRALREGRTPSNAAVHDGLQSAFAKAKPLDSPVLAHRELTIGKDKIDAFLDSARGAAKSGEDYEMRGYISTTVKPDFKPQKATNVEMRINAVHGLDLKPYSQYDTAEAELLLNDKSAFRVKNVFRDGGSGKWVIEMDQLPPKGVG